MVSYPPRDIPMGNFASMYLASNKTFKTVSWQSNKPERGKYLLSSAITNI